MDHSYDAMHRQVEGLKFHLHDAIDDSSHPMADKMENELHGIMEDMQSGRDPRHIETRMRQVQDHLHEMRSHGTTMMSSGDVEHLYHNLEHMRNDLKKLPHY